MTNYYFLSIYLATLNINKKPELSLKELSQLLKDHLIAEDYQSALNLINNNLKGETGFLNSYATFLEEMNQELFELRSRKKSKNSDLNELFHKFKESPKELYLALADYKIKKIDELTGLQIFSRDMILAYLAKFIIISEIFSLNDRAGQKIVDHIEG